MVPLPDEAVWVKHLVCWASVPLGASAVCPGTHLPQLIQGRVCLKECLFMVYCEQSPIEIPCRSNLVNYVINSSSLLLFLSPTSLVLRM